MKKLIFILLFSVPLFVVGQNWSPTGATWHYGFSVWMTNGYYKIEYVGDTTIASIQCKKLRKTLYEYTFWNAAYDTILMGTEYTYADNDKVYIYKHNQFYTLYNFSAQVGETWTVPEIKHYNSCDTVGTVHVDSIGTIIIGGQTLRYIWVSSINTTQQWGWNSKIVERIGPISSSPTSYYDYLFPVKLENCGMEIEEIIEGGDLRCYSDSSFNYSSNIAANCDYITTVNLFAKNSFQIKIYPNPSNGSFTADFDQSIKEILLTDLFGNVILRHQTNNQTQFKIDNLSSGTYILTAMNEDGRRMNKKIISCP